MLQASNHICLFTTPVVTAAGNEENPLVSGGTEDRMAHSGKRDEKAEDPLGADFSSAVNQVRQALPSRAVSVKRRCPRGL